MNNDVEKRINMIEGCSQYVRATPDHPLELYIGKNEKGYPTLRFNGQFKIKKVIGNNILEIKQFKNDDIASILFSYVSKDNISIFYNFCDDIITETQHYEGDNGYKEIVNRYEIWKKLFRSNNKLLDEKEIMGLIGELKFLEDFIFDNYGVTTGLNGWSGPEPTHKDFSYNKDWYEVKTTNVARKEVSISSIEQLDSDTEGNLIVYRLEKMSPSFDGITLNKLVKEIDEKLEFVSDKNKFWDKLAQVGYAPNDVYDNYVYNLVTKIRYKVTDDFPRIKAKTLPKAISKVNYELILALLEKYKED